MGLLPTCRRWGGIFLFLRRTRASLPLALGTGGPKLGEMYPARGCVQAQRSLMSQHILSPLFLFKYPRWKKMNCISSALGFLNRAVSFCTFLSHSPLQQGTISTISHQRDGFQALLPVLLIKQNEAYCSGWLRVDRSKYSYQCTKKPFIKVLSDPKLWIYQSLLTNGIKPNPV